ncbi:MAG TPA: hypothetical protein PLB55_22935 [Prosthecobacter sp.]|nr:hypothetical protein [Prosthecobacter sp.]
MSPLLNHGSRVLQSGVLATKAFSGSLKEFHAPPHSSPAMAPAGRFGPRGAFGMVSAVDAIPQSTNAKRFIRLKVQAP